MTSNDICRLHLPLWICLLNNPWSQKHQQASSQVLISFSREDLSSGDPILCMPGGGTMHFGLFFNSAGVLLLGLWMKLAECLCHWHYWLVLHQHLLTLFLSFILQRQSKSWSRCVVLLRMKPSIPENRSSRCVGMSSKFIDQLQTSLDKFSLGQQAVAPILWISKCSSAPVVLLLSTINQNTMNQSAGCYTWLLLKLYNWKTKKTLVIVK